MKCVGSGCHVHLNSIVKKLMKEFFHEVRTSCYFPMKFALKDSYRIISYRIESYESNGFRMKNFIGSQSYINSLKPINQRSL
jgi:hypothetical protein